MSDSNETKFVLRIYFVGLNMMVRRSTDYAEDGECYQVDELVVLLPNMGSRERIREVTGSNELKVHQTALMYLVPNRFSDVPRFPLLQDDAGYLNGLWLIDREDLEIVKSNGDRLQGGVQINDELRTKKYPDPDGSDRHDWYWISPLRSEKDPNKRQNVRAYFMDDEVYDPHKDLAGRLILRKGRLRNAGFAYDPKDGNCRLFDLGGVEQAISTLVYAEVPITEEKAFIKAEKFDFETPAETLWSPLVLNNFDFDYQGTNVETEHNREDEYNGKPVVEVCLLNLEYDELVEFISNSGGEEDIQRRVVQEHAFLLRLLEEGGQPPPPRIMMGQEPPPEGRKLINHRPWRRWLMPDKNGQSPRPGGKCSSVTASAGGS